MSANGAGGGGLSPVLVTSSGPMSGEMPPGLQGGGVAGGGGQTPVNGLGSGGDLPPGYGFDWDTSAGSAGMMGTHTPNGGGINVNVTLNNSTLNVNNGTPVGAQSYHHQQMPGMPHGVDGLMNPALAQGIDVPSLDPSLGSAARYLNVPESVSGSKVGFPVNLTRMLECAEPMRLAHIVEWLGNGRGFIIHDTDAFLRSAKPHFFPGSKETKIRSFYRKLNRWGFSMTRRNAENQQTSYWSHPGYNRADAVRALDELLACPDQPSMTFLNMSSMSRPIASRRTQNGGLGNSGTSTSSLRFSATSIGTADTMSTDTDRFLENVDALPRPSSLNDVQSVPNLPSQVESEQVAIRQSQIRRSMNDGLMRRADAFHLRHNQSYRAMAMARERNQSRKSEGQRANETFAPMQDDANAFLDRLEQSGQLNNFRMGSLPEGLADMSLQSGPASQFQQVQVDPQQAQGSRALHSMVSSDVTGMLSGGGLGMQQQQQLAGGLNVPNSAHPQVGGLVSAQTLLSMQEQAMVQQQQSAAEINALLANLMTPQSQQSPNWAAQLQHAHNLIAQQQQMQQRQQIQRGPNMVYLQGSAHPNLQSMQQRQHPTVFNGHQPIQQHQQLYEMSQLQQNAVQLQNQFAQGLGGAVPTSSVVQQQQQQALRSDGGGNQQQESAWASNQPPQAAPQVKRIYAPVQTGEARSDADPGAALEPSDHGGITGTDGDELRDLFDESPCDSGAG